MNVNDELKAILQSHRNRLEFFESSFSSFSCLPSRSLGFREALKRFCGHPRTADLKKLNDKCLTSSDDFHAAHFELKLCGLNEAANGGEPF